MSAAKVAIVYHSVSGRTQALAEAVAKGAKAAGAEAEVYAVDAPYLHARLSEADAIVFVVEAISAFRR